MKGRKRKNHPLNSAPAALSAAKGDSKQEQGGVGKEENWFQKDAQLRRAKLYASVKKFEELGKEGSQFPDAPDYDDFDMLAHVHYRLGLVEAYASFDEDGTPQKQGYEAAMSAFHNAIQVRRDLQYNAHFEIDNAQRMQ